MAVITKRKNNLKSKSSMKTKKSSKSKSNSKTRKQFKKFRKNGMGTRKRGGFLGFKRKRKPKPVKPQEPKKKNRTPENHAVLKHLQEKYGKSNLTFAEITQTPDQREKTLSEINKKQEIKQNQQKKRQKNMVEELIDRASALKNNNSVKPSLMGFSPKQNPQQTIL